MSSSATPGAAVSAGRSSRAWTVVHLSADDSPAMRNASILVAWLARQPDVDLHTVLWLPGWADTAPFRSGGRFHDVARDHKRWPVRAARRLGQERRAGALTARAARSNLSTIPPGGVVFLNGVSCGVALRYLPTGDHAVVTNVLAADREAEVPLPPEHFDRLRAATTLWLAEDDPTRAWASTRWDLDADAMLVMPELIDLEAWDERNPPVDDALTLAIAGAPWFSSDHAARLVQCLLARRPSLELDLFWAEVERAEHLAPLLHDLRQLGVDDRLRLPDSHAEVHDQLATSHVLAVTSPDQDVPWLAWEAARKGLPVVCFDVHERAGAVGPDVSGRVVPYLDLPAMAQAVLDIVDEARRPATEQRDAERVERARRDVGAFVHQIVERSGSGQR